MDFGPTRSSVVVQKFLALVLEGWSVARYHLSGTGLDDAKCVAI